ncbi:MAG: hypothetical protein A2600_12335 [Candidatus Lambdaproteobacteria bacterium RIFOXYD1_FULL_56_27]|uniref:Glycosyl transferase family 1 domain-containing protein n=1 Tax=Candidatus Lambdaproteobacteria bacterium RIFOXYD2_FULL_56_26 TaxID=1817773 RepID=A0A1F6GLH9_9PROT|nr:MAG: hypothetical protein A2557_02130 [Candidatus Lambdaproteobacteria bacterium RIFOXYD2_FULL_56_26]OGH02724.1 MAG: hypothetical protein A2426_07345 [Candidatus Lambdaproteobacteria bacterium RIFOXYC1_FULL_56_13]OGH08637.1 MAG: hypothetical protein A2600_12335 [Candidatus Lambdaproteobacteria bacterium RIFOXYD1_FULL_56_27]
MKKKLLIYSDNILFGGSEKVLANLAAFGPLAQTFELAFAFRDHPDYTPGALRLNLPSFPLELASKDSTYFKIAQKKWPKPLHRLAMAPVVLADRFGGSNPQNLARLTDFFLTQKPDLLLINNGGYPGAKTCLTAAVAAKAAGVPKVVMMVNNLATRPRGTMEMERDAKVLAAVDRFVTASKFAGKRLIEFRGVDPNRWLDLPNCLEEQERLLKADRQQARENLGLSEKGLVIGSAGHLTARKGYSVLVEALGLIKPLLEQHSAQVVIIGEGEERHALESRLKELGLAERVKLPGFRPDASKLLAALDIFVLPSVDFEDFPYVNLEAMCLGKPLVGTQVAGIPEQIEEGVNGLVVPPKDPKALAQALETLVKDPKLCQGMGLSSKERFFRLYDYPKVMGRFLALFEELT